MHDNAPIHTTKVVKAFLEVQDIEIMDWPPYLPDLNPIENLWALLKRKIYEHYPDLLHADDSNETKNRLIEAAQEVWDELADELLATLSDTMSNRRDAVLDAKGWYTKY